MISKRTLQPGEADFEGLKNPQDESEQVSENLEDSVDEAAEPSGPATPPFTPAGALSDYPVKLQTDVSEHLYKMLKYMGLPAVPSVAETLNVPSDIEDIAAYTHTHLLLDTFGIEGMTISNQRQDLFSHNDMLVM